MKVKRAVIWWLASNMEPPDLIKDDKRIESLMPLVSTIFPGINYYSITGFNEVMNSCVIPVLQKWFPSFRGMAGYNDIPLEIDVGEFLPSKGYEWQNSVEWKRQFGELLARPMV